MDKMSKGAKVDPKSKIRTTYTHAEGCKSSGGKSMPKRMSKGGGR